MSEKQQAAPRKAAKKWTVGSVISLLILIVSVVSAVYIMANGLGLIDSLDFGAGAYYYADIPAFQRFVNGNAYTSETPMWVIIALFLAWGWLMYRLWVWADRKFQNKPGSPEENEPVGS